MSFSLLPFALGLLWHTLWVWAGLGQAWASLAIAVVVACVLAGTEAVVRAAALTWVYDQFRTGVDALRRVRRWLPSGIGGGRGADGAVDAAKAAWADAEPVLWILAVVLGWLVVQFVTEMTDDVVAKIALLAVALVLIGLDVLSGAWDGGGASATQESAMQGDHEAARHLTASLPLPPALGGGSGKNDRLRFTLDL